MNWKNTFDVEAAPDAVFNTLVDIPTIAPCMPGAQLTGTTGEGHYEGTVKVKLGPITAQYKGKARLTETDPQARRAVLIAEGAETRGQGTASATITATCLPHGSGTSVEIETDLKITGKVAQFGRGVLQDVSAKLIGQFADCLANNVLAPATAAQSPAQTAETGPSTATPNGSSAPASEPAPPRPAPAPFSRPTPDAVDLGQVAGGAVAKRVVPVAAALVLLLLLWRALRARREATAYRAYRLTSSPGSPGSPARQVSST